MVGVRDHDGRARRPQSLEGSTSIGCLNHRNS